MNYTNFGYSSHQGTSYWNMYTGTNCTNYVAYRLVTTNKMPNVRPTSAVGNAQDWGRAMSSITDTRPHVGSVAWWGYTGRHVAYVERVVSSTEIWVSESNWSGAFDWRKITKTTSGWPDGFIHFNDLQLQNTQRPRISGTVKVGATLTAGVGGWTPTGSTYGYRWLADGVAITGATSKTFTPSVTQLGKGLAVTVTAFRTSYPRASATSPRTVVAPGTLRAAEAPIITGTARVDSVLTASSGRWTPEASSYAYQWSVDSSPVAGATSPTFSPRPGDVGHRITVTATAFKTGYVRTGSTSTPSSEVLRGRISSLVKPSISGTPRVGLRLTAKPGTWSRPGLTYAYRWVANGVDLPGATHPTYVPTASDLNKTLAVKVTASRDGYTSASALSPVSGRIAPGTLTATSRPTIAGTARVGSLLTASTGAWSPTATYSFRWFADGIAIAGATERTYLPTSRQLGHHLRVFVTARRPGFTTATSSSYGTVEVASGRIGFTTAPTISGSARLGSVVRAVPGTSSPSTLTMRYQWLRDGKTLSGATSSAHRVNVNDLGKTLSVRVTASAAGYETRSITTAKIGPAKSTSAMTASTTRGTGTVTFVIRVTAPGVAAPDGRVSISSNAGVGNAGTVRDGWATVTLTRQKAGTYTYHLTFGGTSTVTSARLMRTITIR
ncbi:CHAP domain-containing protein [Aeromicrobium sp.]|uniref:CHAP domain-containing protein n=1 Tax=Aeromicrobium sp. TaxID=1871063 RepID=UPI0019B25520|nr:CHAP domain-containing protein [Aeromicrobium sp.]MBC7632294.1 hypothetical protein [Aeromicrobium sp.]